MTLPVAQQIIQQLHTSTNVLVCLPKNPTTDAIASGLAMYSVLQKLGKKAKIVADGFALPSSHRFLPKSDEIMQDLSPLKQFIISMNVADAPVETIAYDIVGEKLQIYVTPKTGSYSNKEVRVETEDYNFDLIVTLDSRDLRSLGAVFHHNADFFHHTPIVNIDHHPGNEHYGQINVIDVTASSVSEQVFLLLEHLDKPVLDEYMATSLLAGIISKTKSFKANSVTPKSLAIASHLVSNGARRDEIVKHLFQTKSIHTLQLWGRALSRLSNASEHKIVSSLISRQDFIETETSPLDIESVIDELIVNTPDAEHIFVAYEQTDTSTDHDVTTIHAIVYTAPYLKGLEVFRDWRAEGSRNFTYIAVPASSLQQAEMLIIERLKQHLQ